MGLTYGHCHVLRGRCLSARFPVGGRVPCNAASDAAFDVPLGLGLCNACPMFLAWSMLFIIHLLPAVSAALSLLYASHLIDSSAVSTSRTFEARARLLLHAYNCRCTLHTA